MRAAVIVNGKVSNIIEVDSLDVLNGVELVDAPHSSIGDLWDGENFTSQPYDVGPSNSPPQSVTMRQARLALLSIGVLDDVDQAINSLSSPEKEKARIEWDYSSTVDRNRPFVATLGHALKLDDAALDQLFIEAAKL